MKKNETVKLPPQSPISQQALAQQRNDDPDADIPDGPGFLESLIPIWGSRKQAIHDYESGHSVWGTINTAFAVTDVFLIKAVATGIGKIGITAGDEVFEGRIFTAQGWRKFIREQGLWKSFGSHSWGATKSWMRGKGYRQFVEQVNFTRQSGQRVKPL